MSLFKQFKTIISKQKHEYSKDVKKLAKELIEATPVDSGKMKRSWSFKKVGEFSYSIKNHAKYSGIIAGGRRVVNGKMYGSEQLPMGFDPIIEKFKRKKV